MNCGGKTRWRSEGFGERIGKILNETGGAESRF
jgi:hypothetical protein